MRLASYEVTIAAPVEVVWAHLTAAEGLIHHGLPETVADHQQGWRYFLDILRDTLSAG